MRNVILCLLFVLISPCEIFAKRSCTAEYDAALSAFFFAGLPDGIQDSIRTGLEMGWRDYQVSDPDGARLSAELGRMNRSLQALSDKDIPASRISAISDPLRDLAGCVM